MLLLLWILNLITLNQSKSATITIKGGSGTSLVANKQKDDDDQIKIIASGTDGSDLTIHVNHQRLYHDKKSAKDKDDASSLEEDDDGFGKPRGVCWEVEQRYESMRRLYHNAITHEVKLDLAYTTLVNKVETMGHKRGNEIFS